jgi:hypothetical protein
VFQTSEEFVEWQNGLETNISIEHMEPVIPYSHHDKTVNQFENNINYNTSNVFNTIGIFIIYTEHGDNPTKEE